MTLSIIIISYNTKQLLFECLASIPENRDYQTIVVDNASKDGSADMVAKDFPHASLIRSKTNTGFAHANNLGLKVAQGRHVIFLNSDTQIKEGALKTLIKFLESNQQIGAVTPQVILPDGSLDLACHRGMPTPWNAFTYFSKLESLLPSFKLFSGYHQTYKNFDQPHQIDATAMTAMMIKRQVIQEIGDLDYSFFLYGEDLDYCKRLTDAGYQIWYIPQASILHHKSASGKKNRLNKKERASSTHHFYDTMKQFYEKHYQHTYPKWLRHLVYTGIALKKKLHRY